jgi:hypothetical protein
MTYGAVDFLALEFQSDRLRGEIMPALLDLVEKQIVRVIDLVIIQKNEDGSHEAVEMNQLAPDLMRVFDPLKVEVSGIIQVEDIEGIAEIMDNGTLVAAMLFENLWSIKFKEAVLRANGRVLEHLRVPPEVVEDALVALASAEGKD